MDMDDYEYEYEYEYGYKYICIENLFLKYKYCNLKINLSQLLKIDLVQGGFG